MRFIDLIRKKRDSHELSADEIGWMIRQYSADAIPDYQMSAWLMAAFLRGLSPAELAALTSAMLHSGRVLDLSALAAPKVDKHSTGGVGDKTSLIIAPLAASAGVVVPMISGRGLGHTGGTLDKLESIPGFSVNLDIPRFTAQLASIGVALIGQTEDLAPADKRLYALRDVTGTVESQSLICASIMSKKLAEGIDALVLDVKFGSGAFMKRVEDARSLAHLMVETGERMNKRVAALLTDMDQPLGNCIGNALEVRECIDVLKTSKDAPADLIELSVALTAWMLLLGGISPSLAAAEDRVRSLIADGSGLRKFRDIITAQGGDPRVCDDPSPLPRARHTQTIAALTSGYVQHIDSEKIGVASLVLGGGREKKEDAVDPAVGLVLSKKVGDRVASGEALCTVHYNSDARLTEALALIESAYAIASSAPIARKLIHGIVQTSGGSKFNG